MYRNGNFCLVFGRREILLTYMIFVYLGIKDLKKNEKRPKFFSKAIDKATATLIEIL